MLAAKFLRDLKINCAPDAAFISDLRATPCASSSSDHCESLHSSDLNRSVHPRSDQTFLPAEPSYDRHRRCRANFAAISQTKNSHSSRASLQLWSNVTGEPRRQLAPKAAPQPTCQLSALALTTGSALSSFTCPLPDCEGCREKCDDAYRAGI